MSKQPSKSNKPHSALPAKSAPPPSHSSSKSAPPPHRSSAGASTTDVAHNAVGAASNAANGLLHFIENLLRSAQDDNGFSLAVYGAVITIAAINLYKQI